MLTVSLCARRAGFAAVFRLQRVWPATHPRIFLHKHRSTGV